VLSWAKLRKIAKFDSIIRVISDNAIVHFGRYESDRAHISRYTTVLSDSGAISQRDAMVKDIS
jgi:hypothetical protein